MKSPSREKAASFQRSPEDDEMKSAGEPGVQINRCTISFRIDAGGHCQKSSPVSESQTQSCRQNSILGMPRP
jgi:hypothetical protein